MNARRRLPLLAGALGIALALALQICAASFANAAPSGSGSASSSAAPAPSGTPAPSGSAAPSGTADPATNANFGLQPAGADAPDSRPYFSFGATPGAKVSDHIAIMNIGGDALPLSIYPTDAVSADNGNISFLTSDQKPEGVGAWVTLNAGAQPLTVPGRSASGAPGDMIIPFSVAVPANASPGDHVGAIIASLRVVSTDPSGSKVNLDQRIAMRIYIRVTGDAIPQLTIEKLKVVYHGVVNPLGAGSATVTYVVRNSGNIVLGAHQAVALTALVGGSKAASALTDVTALLPGASVPMTVRIRDVLPALRLTAKVTLRPTLGVASDAAVTLTTVTATAHTWAVPWTLIVLLLLLAGGLWRLVVWLRSRPSQGQTPKSGGGDPTDGGPGGGPHDPPPLPPTPGGPGATDADEPMSSGRHASLAAQ